jgi:uncharacterized protein YggE
LVVGVLSLAVAGPVAADTSPPASTLTVDGQGSVMLAPDRAILTVDVEARARSAVGARGKANRRTRAVLGAIARAGVDRDAVQTSGLGLARERVGSPGHERTVYVGSSSLTVAVKDIKRVGRVIDAATRAGAQSIDGPQFFFGDPSPAKRRAARAALADARARADDAAAAVGYRVTGVQSIVIDSRSAPSPPAAGIPPSPPRAERRHRLAERFRTPVNPGREPIDATVSVVFTIAPAG